MVKFSESISPLPLHLTSPMPNAASWYCSNSPLHNWDGFSRLIQTSYIPRCDRCQWFCLTSWSNSQRLTAIADKSQFCDKSRVAFTVVPLKFEVFAVSVVVWLFYRDGMLANSPHPPPLYWLGTVAQVSVDTSVLRCRVYRRIRWVKMERSGREGWMVGIGGGWLDKEEEKYKMMWKIRSAESTTVMTCDNRHSLIHARLYSHVQAVTYTY